MSGFKIYECPNCNYVTDVKFNYQKHLESKKHIKKAHLLKKKFSCSTCFEKFNNNVSLWRHKKKCIKKYDYDGDIDIDYDSEFEAYINDELDAELDDEFDAELGAELDTELDTELDHELDHELDDEYKAEIDRKFEAEIDRKFEGKENVTMLQIMQQMCEQNMQLKEQLHEQQKEFHEQQKEFQEKTTEMMMEIVKSNNNVNNNVNNIAINCNNTSTNTNHFNLNFFLNETCKDAMSIDDFLDSIEITISDLKRLGKDGYVEALSALLIENLKEIDITRRPMHCSDIKRETIYIRDLKGWEKENSHKVRLNRVLNEITRLNTIALQGLYQKMYPHCLTDHKSKEHKEYGEIVYNAFGGKGDLDQLNKIIIRNLIKVIKIQK